jgi:hypothetical protein
MVTTSLHDIVLIFNISLELGTPITASLGNFFLSVIYLIWPLQSYDHKNNLLYLSYMAHM